MDPIKYFAFFKYAPTVEEYLRFAQTKTIPRTLKIVGERVVNANNKKYLKGTIQRQQISQSKLNRRLWLIKLFAQFPGVLYMGISGTVSMLNANKADDIDLFVITKSEQLFTTRFWLVISTTLLGVRRRRQEKEPQDKLCLNLFFSEDNLLIPKHKRNLYVAHEIGQLKTVVNKEHTYERFLWANRWIKDFFPNLPVARYPNQKKSVKIKVGERVVRFVQLWLINKHRTTEIITDTQLWFFPDDFEQRLQLP